MARDLGVMRPVGPVLGVLFLGLFCVGVVRGDGMLIRLASAFSALAVMTALLGPLLMQSTRLRRLSIAVLICMGVAFGALVVMTEAFGGGALNGRITSAGEHYLSDHGRETLVSRTIFYSVAAVEMLVFASWPAGIVFGLRTGLLGSPGPPNDELQRTRPAQAKEPRR